MFPRGSIGTQGQAVELTARLTGYVEQLFSIPFSSAMSGDVICINDSSSDDEELSTLAFSR